MGFLRLIVPAVSVMIAMAPFPAYADFSYFEWEPFGPNGYSSSAGNVNATLNYSTLADDTAAPVTLSLSDLAFIDSYGSSVDAFSMSNGVAGSSADGVAEISFDMVLPENSILIAFDLDTIRLDEFRFSNTQKQPDTH